MKRIKAILDAWLIGHARLIVSVFYGDFWSLRRLCLSRNHSWERKLYFSYLDSLGSWIGLETEMSPDVLFPHGMASIFISKGAKIGSGCIIHQQVTIGSVSGAGAPTIGNNVMIGAGAIIVGKVHVGDDAKIGAGAVVVKDVPAGATCVTNPMRIIERA